MSEYFSSTILCNKLNSLSSGKMFLMPKQAKIVYEILDFWRVGITISKTSLLIEDMKSHNMDIFASFSWFKILIYLLTKSICSSLFICSAKIFPKGYDEMHSTFINLLKISSVNNLCSHISSAIFLYLFLCLSNLCSIFNRGFSK